jgi:hypothetical protein
VDNRGRLLSGPGSMLIDICVHTYSAYGRPDGEGERSGNDDYGEGQGIGPSEAGRGQVLGGGAQLDLSQAEGTKGAVLLAMGEIREVSVSSAGPRSLGDRFEVFPAFWVLKLGKRGNSAPRCPNPRSDQQSWAEVRSSTRLRFPLDTTGVGRGGEREEEVNETEEERRSQVVCSTRSPPRGWLER